MKIADIFFSAQGEGLRMGHPAVFVRLAGCSLRCGFCDTPHALSGGTDMSVPVILEEVLRLAPFPGVQVVITGGEPLEQDLTQIVVTLARKGFFLSVETNGLHFQDLAIHWWAVSPKPAAAFRVHPAIRSLADEVKLVVVPELSLETVHQLRQCMPQSIFYLQPNARDEDGYATAWCFFDRCVREGIKDVRLGLQLQRIFKIP
ncbi:MAG TPA: 7-carboxy-7-deazaguanine synthase QueE [Candidatus Aminicenantes bacterium]|nr:7-carboxy-7-deazaguanine synthase QueE [Candidatus Aminicenantes bacterium]